MALLDNFQVRKSTVRREIVRTQTPLVWEDESTFHTLHTQEIPWVEVQMSERDWQQIEQIVQAHKREIKNPAVQDAWDQYVMLTHLTKTLKHC